MIENQVIPKDTGWSRRSLLRSFAALGSLGIFQALLPSYARAIGALTAPTMRASRDTLMDIAIREQSLEIAGGIGKAITLNNSVPGPIVELYEGQEAHLRVTNHLGEESSIHWHGLLLPFEMDGVPGVTFPGIAPGETYEVRFPVRQYGTYWYHSHSGLQEQSGVYGPLVIHPKAPEPFTYERDYVVMLSDWTFEDPHHVAERLKKMSDYYNYRQQTLGDFVADARKNGFVATLKDRLAWSRMRMMPTDIADVTGATYSYLMNGLHPAGNWTGIFQPGERVRLRFINAAAMSYFNVRIPGLAMRVVQADGQNIEPVEIDEFQIGVAETFDVIVEPQADMAYTLMAESMDRTGYTRGTLAPRLGMQAPVPELRELPMRSMVDMGMDMSSMDMGNMSDSMESTAMPAQMDMGSMDHSMHQMDMPMPDMAADQPMDHMMMASAGPVVANHGADHHGRGNNSVAEVQRDRLAEPGTGLENVSHRVLTYAQLRNLVPMRDKRPVSRTFELHLTGNMERYMWSFDGEKFSEVKDRIHFPYGERIRLILVNDTMMEHPIHLHGMFMELENGQGDHLPYKHTISVKPSERLSLLITVDEPGRWAFHCHLLYHMEMGMFRVVEVTP